MRRKHARRHRKEKPHFSVRAGKRLAAWARKLAEGVLGEEEEDRMEELVQKYLRSASDQVFAQAFAELAGEEEAASELQNFLEFESECVPVLIANAEGEESAGLAMLFAIPMVFFVAPGASMPTHLEGETLDAAAKSLRRHSLIGKEPSVLLLSGIYPWANLAVPFSRQWLAVNRLAKRLLDPAIPDPFPGPEPMLAAEQFSMALRFLVGLVLLPLEEKSLPFSDLPEERLESWSKELSGLLSAPDAEVWVGNPESFNQALREGLDWFRRVGMEMAAENAAEAAAQSGGRCRVEVQERGDKLTFSFLDGEGNLLGRYEFPVLEHDSPETWSDFWTEAKIRNLLERWRETNAALTARLSRRLPVLASRPWEAADGRGVSFLSCCFVNHPSLKGGACGGTCKPGVDQGEP